MSDKQLHGFYDEKRFFEFVNKIPALTVPPGLDIQPRPGYPGALLRFRISDKNDKSISVYLDVEDNLGFVGQPYWELYPNKDGDCSRYLLHEAPQMMREISDLLD